MMILRSAPPSPFGRKVKIAAHILGLNNQISIVQADTGDINDPLRASNPLGKIPCLTLANGTHVYDSRVILEYFDYLAGGNKIIPAEPLAKLQVMTRQALADGLMDAALAIVYETRWRAEAMRDAKWIAHHQGKIDRALEELVAHPAPGFTDIGQIATACALGYLDLRFAGTWRASNPALVDWLHAFSSHVPSFETTKVLPA